MLILILTSTQGQARREGAGKLPRALGAPSNFFGRSICVFRAKCRNFVWKKLWKVPREQLKRSWAGNFFPEKLGIGAPETNLPRAPEKLSAALHRSINIFI
jgi:hypothetical protein